MQHFVAPPRIATVRFDRRREFQLTSNIVVAIAADARAVRTVLLVEDYATLLKKWTRELQHDGKKVLGATTGEAALELARQTPPDVAVVDLFLASENGVNVIRQLREQGAKCHIVLISAHMSVSYAMAAVHAGADDVYFKPSSLRHLLNCIERGVRLEADPDGPTLEQLEWEHISRVLLDCQGNITRAAERLGIYRQTLQRKLRRHTPR